MSEKVNSDIRPKLKKALKKYQKQTGKKMTQRDFDPLVHRSHVNNVASGKSRNDRLRQRMEKFIEKYG